MKTMAEWRQLIRVGLGKKLVRKTSEIALDIHCVSIGVKPGFLFDYGSVTREQIRSLLQSAYREGLLVSNTLRIVSVDTDVVIINPGRLEQHVHMLEKKNIVRFIDVSGRLHAPELLGLESLHKVHPSIVCVRAILQHAAATHQESDDFKEFSANISPLANVTTVYGLLLGYPIVYWYELDDDHEFGKCLSMEPIRNVKLWGSGFQVRHKNTFPQVNVDWSKGSNCCQTNNLPDCESRQQLISSFSFPERFVSELKSGVDTWCFDLISSKSHSEFGFRMTHKTEEVTSQSAVLL